MDVHEISRNCKRTEFVGTALLDTIGLCIAGVDDKLLQTMNIGTRYHALGLFSSRTGAAGQLTAMDEAVKSTGTEILSIDFPRDTKGWGGHGNYMVIGGDSVSDVRDAIRIALELTNQYAGELYISEAGHLNLPIQPVPEWFWKKLFRRNAGRLSALWPALLQPLVLSWPIPP
ncbi:MAG: BMC domain-containing protein [Blautia sp.]